MMSINFIIISFNSNNVSLIIGVMKATKSMKANKGIESDFVIMRYNNALQNVRHRLQSNGLKKKSLYGFFPSKAQFQIFIFIKSTKSVRSTTITQQMAINSIFKYIIGYCLFLLLFCLILLLPLFCLP